ncbi:glycosyltransferase [Mycobacterium sp. IDR2000157661]|uniref:glycosyltransferase n=1 Tax=Mycobacterium sp. IDR2000157661 TaxID=2867005 RepID=UPI001EED04B8|nr:glycosyltransferase [Mycobacterium sp. IDR2000157661]ULE35167.1 glycosyltransferase [Mycobacterium sp. IDR2000157661]
MRVCLATWGSRGDVEPMAALALRLGGMGADVRLCAPPDFSDLADRAKVSLTALGDPIRDFLHGAKPATPADAPATAARLVALQFETVAAAAEGCDAVVASGLMPAGVRSVAEYHGARYVCAMLHTGSIPSPHQTPLPRPGKPFPPGETDTATLWEIDAERVNALYREPLNEGRAALGLPPVDNVRDHVFTDTPWLAADPTLAPWPGSPGFDVVRTGAWLLPDRRPLPDDLLAFLDSGPPPVFVGTGSVRAPVELARAAIDAARAHGRRVVLARSWAGLAPVDDGADCITVDEVNHQRLFPRVAAVIHHGGAGTTTAAARAGVPQVVVPQFADQPYWARRVAELGIGAAHDVSVPTAESLADALQASLTADTRARAHALAPDIRTDGAAAAAARLFELVGSVPTQC